MAAVLVRTVVAGGTVYPAGTGATPALRARIPARFWDEPSTGNPDAAAADPAPEPAPGSAPAAAYDGRRVADLEAEIKTRNASRVEPLKPASGRRDDLIAALRADDARRQRQP